MGMTTVSIKHLLLISIFVLTSGRLTGGETIAISDSVFSAKIERDEWGVPHIYGKRDADVSFGLAYAHAQDDYKTIEDIMFALRGKLASIYGRDAAVNAQQSIPFLYQVRRRAFFL